jgi:hypothetical protein
MKKIILLLLFCQCIQFSYGQISSIKKQLKELYFEIGFPSSKYDIRKMLNSSNNFSDISEINIEEDDIFSAYFDKNFKLSYVNKSIERKFDYVFNKGTDNNFCVGLVLRYYPEDISSCTKQFNEAIGFFKGISYKSYQRSIIEDGIKLGETYSFYSSKKSDENSKSYLIISMEYRALGEIRNKSESDKMRYSFSIGYYVNNLY